MSTRPAHSLFLVHNELLGKVRIDASGTKEVRDTASLGDIFEGVYPSERLQQMRLQQAQCFVVPDFWLGTKTYPIATQKRALVETFIQRKLRADHPELLEVQDFFYHVPGKTTEGKKGVRVSYFPDPNFFLTYQTLEKYNFAPTLVTTPGLLWEGKLQGLLPDFDQGGICLVALVDTECFFYFFYKGQYVFSRDIAISSQFELEDKLGTVSYEINQSRFLFSQKVSAEIDRTYLVTSGTEGIDAINLSEQLGREVVDLPIERPEVKGEQSDLLNPLLYFSTEDLTPSDKTHSLTHRLIKREHEWRSVQWAAIAIAALLTLLLAGEAIFLTWYGSEDETLLSATAARQRRELGEYTQLLDKVARQIGQPKAHHVLAKALQALPAGLDVTALSYEDGRKPSISLEFRTTPKSLEAFEAQITQILENIKDRFELKRIPPENLRYTAETPANASRLAYRVSLLIEVP